MLFPQKIWMLNLKLQPCEATETILLKNILYGDVKPPSKKLSCSLSFSMVAQFLWKTYRPPLKEHCWHLFGKERYLFGGKVSFTKNKVHQPHFLWKSKKYWKYEALIPITLFISTYATLPSKKSSCLLFGQERILFEKNILTTKGNVNSQRPHTSKENCPQGIPAHV